MKSAITAFIIGFLMVWFLYTVDAIRAHAHNGYEGIKNAMGGDCCGNHDCRPAEEGEVEQRQDGIYWRGIKVPDGKLGPAPAGYQVQYHVCENHGSLYCILTAMGF